MIYQGGQAYIDEGKEGILAVEFSQCFGLALPKGSNADDINIESKKGQGSLRYADEKFFAVYHKRWTTGSAIGLAR